MFLCHVLSCLVPTYYEEDMIFGQLSCFIAAILRLFGHFRHLEVFNSNTDGIWNQTKSYPLKSFQNSQKYLRYPTKKQSFSKAFLLGTSNFFGPSYFETVLVNNCWIDRNSSIIPHQARWCLWFTLIFVINVESRLLILIFFSTLHAHFHPPHLFIELLHPLHVYSSHLGY